MIREGRGEERRAGLGLVAVLPLQQVGGSGNQTNFFGAPRGRVYIWPRPRPDPGAGWLLGCGWRCGRAGGRACGGVGAMATFVSELEAAKKNLSEALGDNVKQ